MKDDQYKTLIDNTEALVGGSTFEALMKRTKRDGQQVSYRNAKWRRGKIGSWFWEKVEPMIAFKKVKR